MAAVATSAAAALRQVAERSLWEMRRQEHALRRRFGSLAYLVPSVVVACSAAVLLSSAQQRRLADTRLQIADGKEQSSPAPAALPSVRALGTARLGEFEALLPEHDDVPAAVASLLGLAQDAGLSIKRGEYKMSVDPTGGFARYQMSLPVSGDPGAIVGFMRSAMLEHRTLTIESVRFSRPDPDARRVDARVQWNLLVRLPRTVGTAEHRAAVDAGPRITP